MPLPKPESGEKEEAFMSRCLQDGEIRSEFPTLNQQLGVCRNLFDRKK